MLKEVTKVSPQVSKNITVPVSSSPKMSNIMQSIANSLPPHLSPVKITFTKPTIQTTSTTTQKVSSFWSLPLYITLHFSQVLKPRLLPGDHCDNLSQLQLCAQHPFQISKQRHSVQTGLRLHSGRTHSEASSGVDSQHQPRFHCQCHRSDHSGLLHTLCRHVNGNL